MGTGDRVGRRVDDMDTVTVPDVDPVLAVAEVVIVTDRELDNDAESDRVAAAVRVAASDTVTVEVGTTDTVNETEVVAPVPVSVLEAVACDRVVVTVRPLTVTVFCDCDVVG